MPIASVRSACCVLLCGLLIVGLARAAQPQVVYLDNAGLRTALEGYTLIGKDWAEFYAPDGTIKGKARTMGTLRTYDGRWRVADGKVCYDYEGTLFDTCSRLRQESETVRHFTLDGQPKPDGVARRVKGDHVASALD
jgi:hypothetical protein